MGLLSPRCFRPKGLLEYAALSEILDQVDTARQTLQRVTRLQPTLVEATTALANLERRQVPALMLGHER